ncbi:MAG: Mov34/MPN/PAD-1 family protein [Fimbriimonadales bacterium]
MSKHRNDWALWTGAVAWGVLAAWAIAGALRSRRPASSEKPPATDPLPEPIAEIPAGPVLFLEEEAEDPCTEISLAELRSLYDLGPVTLDASPTVLIFESALERMMEHLRLDTTVELGGVLFGRAYRIRESGSCVPVITHSAAGHGARSGAASLEIGTEAWSSILAEASSEGVDEPVVGWYHSHPGLGVFLSGVDLCTQRSHFHHDWSVAIVVDPRRHEIGAFLGAEGSRVQLRLVPGQGAPLGGRQESGRLRAELGEHR